MKNRTILKMASKEFTLKMIVSFLMIAATLIIPMIFGATVDYVTEGDMDTAYIFAIMLACVCITYRLIEIYNTHVWYKLYNKMYYDYTRVALDKTFNNSLFSLSRLSISEYLNIMNDSINVMCTFFADLPIKFFRGIEFLIIIGYFFMMNTYIGLASVLISIIAFTIMIISSKPIERTNDIRTNNLDKKTGAIHELMLCIKEIKTLNIFRPIKDRVLNSSGEYTKSLMKQGITEDSFRFGNALFIEAFKVLLFIYGIFLISKGQMQIGIVIIIYNYYDKLVTNMGEFSIVNNQHRKLKVATSKYNKILEYSSSQEVENKILNKNPNGEVQFKNILYGYRNDPTLDNISFHFKPNTLNALTGPSGSGKSGIFDLLLRLNRQHEGSILIDGIEINKYSAEEYFYLVSSVFKEPAFFNMTIKQNLCLIEENFEKVINICEDLGIHDDIVKLPYGYETMIDNKASAINSNLRYLLDIARVLLKGTKIILFDENFGNFDKTTKSKVIELLFNLKKTNTIIIITKDQEILKRADNILLINNCDLIATGRHDDLIKRDLYKENITK